MVTNDPIPAPLDSEIMAKSCTTDKQINLVISQAHKINQKQSIRHKKLHEFYGFLYFIVRNWGGQILYFLQVVTSEWTLMIRGAQLHTSYYNRVYAAVNILANLCSKLSKVQFYAIGNRLTGRRIMSFLCFSVVYSEWDMVEVVVVTPPFMIYCTKGNKCGVVMNDYLV